MSDIKILIIVDDVDLLRMVSVVFKRAGYQVFTAANGLDGMIKFFMSHPHLIILDTMLPDCSGIYICQRIRQISEQPVIMLTALNRERDILRCLAAGADEFLSKPINPEILLVCARTLLRRYQHSDMPGNVQNPFNYNDGYLSIDIERYEVLIQRKRVELTPIEFRLLVYLARNGGKLLTFEKIITSVWGNQYQGSLERVHVYISHLRKKIEEDSGNARYIRTIYGMGYIFEKQEFEYAS